MVVRTGVHRGCMPKAYGRVSGSAKDPCPPCAETLVFLSAAAYGHAMPNHRYDLLVIDLDGTLLDRSNRVPVENRRAIERAREAGIEVMIATGRALVESREALSMIDHDGLVVTAGGSMLNDARSGETRRRFVLTPDVVREVTNRLLEHGHKVLILKDAHAAGYDYLAVGRGRMNPASEWWFSTMNAVVRHADHVDLDEHPDHTVRTGVVADSDHLAPLADSLREVLGERAFLQHWAAVTAKETTGSSTHLLEVFSPNVNKWTMISAYGRDTGRDAERIAAIGDGLNDVELVQAAGLGIAMANADERVRRVADRHTLDHEQAGVAYAIDRILEGAW